MEIIKEKHQRRSTVNNYDEFNTLFLGEFIIKEEGRKEIGIHFIIDENIIKSSEFKNITGLFLTKSYNIKIE